ncbi:synergin gamma-like isoform X3 [Sphaerodactylus townsendi]|uniref:synergin gamma-like isoform X3 n=1 Tax=Sphaerodactylus townsendi TaxID=933632 RepID=UPI002025F16E|nr:synergin gamma-like isoform X3 [Sphaerodactylus townsendi]
MTSETAHLIQCLQQIHKVIGKANEILAGVSNPSVCSEVLLSKPGTAYMLGLFEVYRVSKRLEEGVKTRQPASELLRHTLREVDLAWNNLLSFLAFGHPLLQMLVPTGNSDSVIYQGSCYHVSCANFWLNCVDSTLPRQK